MRVYEMAKGCFVRGLWSAEGIRALVAAWKLTQAQAEEIMRKGV